jgi:hypothetical protein
LVSVLWNDWDASEIPDSGLFYNGGLPGRAIFTWLNIPPFPANVESPRVTIQIILFADGRVQFGYNGVNVPFGVVGISAGPGAPRSVIDFTALSNFTFAGPAVIAEEFDSNPFDMDSHFVTWTPNAEAGFDVRVVAGAASPDSPAESRISLAGVRPPLGSTTKPLTISFISRPGQRYRLESMVARGAESTGWERATEPFVGTGAELTIELPPHAYTGELLYRVIRLE